MSSPCHPSTNTDQEVHSPLIRDQISPHAPSSNKRHGNLLAPVKPRVIAVVGNHPLLRSLVIELRTFPWRIGTQRKLIEADLHPSGNGAWILDLGPGWVLDASGHSVLCKRTHACIQDIETFASTYPKATMFEEWVFLQAWNMGVESALRNFDISEKDEGGVQA